MGVAQGVNRKVGSSQGVSPWHLPSHDSGQRGRHIRNLPSAEGGTGLGSWAYLLDLLIGFESVTHSRTHCPREGGEEHA